MGLRGMRGGQMRTARAVAAGLSLALTLGLAALGPAIADTEKDKEKVDSAVAAAGDDLQAANARVQAAIADLVARGLYPARLF